MTVASAIPMVEIPSTFIQSEFETVCQSCRITIRGRLISQKTLSSLSAKIVQRSPRTPSPGLENAHGHRIQRDSDFQFAVRVLECEIPYVLAFLSTSPSPGPGLGQFPRNHTARSLRCRSTPLSSKGNSNGQVQGHVYCGMYISFLCQLRQFESSADALVQGNGVYGSVFYAFPAVAATSSVFSPLSLLVACLLLFLYRPLLLDFGEESSYKRRKLHISFAIRRQSIRYFRCCCDAF